MPDIDFGRISESLNEKSDRDLRNVDTTAKADAVIDYQEPTAENGYTWYRKYKSGWVEQGGQHLWNKTCPNRVSITYPIPMANAVNALFITRPKGIGDVQAYDGDGCESQTATGFISAGLSGGNSATNSFVWQVSGMAA